LKPGRPRGRSLRRQVLATFALGTILVTGAVSLVTYGASRSYLFRQRRTYATRLASANARLMDNLSRARPDSIPELLRSLETPAGSVPLLYEGGRWYSATPGQTEELVPAAVRRDVISGRRQRDESFRAGGLRLTSVEAVERFILAPQVASAIDISDETMGQSHVRGQPRLI
jgi:hypothetical protein